MATEFLMPKLGLTMEAGTIIEWLIADGSAVAAGVAILRIETDKTETEVAATSAGRLHVVGVVGDTFACGERIGWLLAPGEEPPSAGSATTPAATAPAATATPAAPAAIATAAVASAVGGRIIASPLAKRLAAEQGRDLRTVRGTGPGGRIVAADLEGLAAPPSPMSLAGLWPATGPARQLAELLGIDISRVPLDSISGRVTRESVALHARELLAKATGPSRAAEVNTPTTPNLPTATQPPSSTVRFTGMRGTIARRMRDSLTQMAQLTLFMDADLDAVVADRTRRAEHGAAPSYTDYVIAAAARALGQHPIANSQITADGVALLPVVHVAMAVALDGGLIVPVITNTAARNLASLAVESSRLAEAARAGALQLAELEGGTFSVSTLGLFGVDGFTPVINPPNTCILGVGRLRDDIVLDSVGGIATKKRLTLSLTWDHRAFDGAPAAAFCKSIVELLNDVAALDTPAT